MYHSKTLLVKQGTFLHELWPDSTEKRDILNTGNLDIPGIDIGNLFIGELFITSESRTLDFQTVEYLWMGGIRRIEESNSRLTEL